MDWYRQYAEFAYDPKVQSMSEAMQRRLIMLFCLRCSNSLQTLGNEEIAFALRISPEDTADTKTLFTKKGFIDDKWNIVHWDNRQAPSDRSNERVKKYRERRYSQGLSANGYAKHTVTVTERDSNCCVYCGSDKNLCIDHILPIYQGGNDDIENLACACKECNSGKAGKTPEQAGYSFLNKECEKRWNKWMSRDVTVTVTPQIREEKKERKNKQKENFALPDWIPKDDWNAWVEIRKPKSNTANAFRLAIGRLEKFRQQGFSPAAVLQNCILNGWQGIYAPKQENWRSNPGYDRMPSPAGG